MLSRVSAWQLMDDSSLRMQVAGRTGGRASTERVASHHHTLYTTQALCVQDPSCDS